jgi:hypothetical protein
MCDLIGKTQSADNLRSSAALSTCYRPYAEFLEQHTKPNRAFQKRCLLSDGVAHGRRHALPISVRSCTALTTRHWRAV